MKFHTFPGTDLSVSRLCFGCWGVISDAHWGDRAEQESVGAMEAALEAGVNFFDTAPMYGDGASEQLLGQFLADRGVRDQVVIASKIRPSAMRADDVVKDCEASLDRLQTDYLDLYQTHWTSPDVPITETWEAMQRLQEAGKVRHLGGCNMGPGDLGAVAALQTPLTNQLPYNLLWRQIEHAIVPRCLESGIGILVYSPLLHGILADKYQSAEQVPDGRARTRHFSTDRALARHGEPGCEMATFQTLDAIREIAAGLDRSMADVALAWVLQQAGVACVIAGARNAEQVADNLRCLEEPLPAEVDKALRDATGGLLATLGDNVDMWDGGENARYC